MDILNDRLANLLQDHKEYTQASLAKALGCPNQTVNNWVKRGTSIPADKVFPICKYFNIPIEAFILGEGGDAPSYIWADDDELDVLNLYRSLDAAGKHIARKQMLDYRRATSASVKRSS